MSILQQQGIKTFGTVTIVPPEFEDAGTPHNPFSRKDQDFTASLGFGGYTYAQDQDLQQLFKATPENDRFGPTTLNKTLGAGPTYATEGDAYKSDTFPTLLGQMAEMLAQPSVLPGWGEKGAAPQMAYTFTNSSSVRSQKNTASIPTGTLGEGNPIASGGSFKGFDFEHQYAMKNEGSSNVNAEQPRRPAIFGGDLGIDNLVPWPSD